MLKELSVLGSIFLGLIIAGIIAISLIPSSRAENCVCTTKDKESIHNGKCVSDSYKTICGSKIIMQQVSADSKIIVMTQEEVDEKEKSDLLWKQYRASAIASGFCWYDGEINPHNCRTSGTNTVTYPKGPMNDPCLYPDGIWRNCPITKRVDMYKELSKLPVKEVLEGLADGYLSNTKGAEDMDKYLKDLQRSHDLWKKPIENLTYSPGILLK